MSVSVLALSREEKTKERKEERCIVAIWKNKLIIKQP